MEQCRGGCSHEMVKSPATAATMAYPTEEEKRSHRRIGGINGNDNDDDDDDVVQSNGNREARSRDLVLCRVCDIKSDRDDDLESYMNDHNNGSRIDTTDTSNRDFTCSVSSNKQSTSEAAERFSESPSSQESESRPGGKENHLKIRRSRKQSRPRQIVWHRDHRKRYLIPALGLQNVRNKKFKIYRKSVHSQQRSTSQRTFKCHLCPKYAPARGKTHRPYHSRASLTLHMLWRHKRGSWSTKNQTLKNNLASTVSSVTLKATFFNNPNYRYDR